MTAENAPKYKQASWRDPDVMMATLKENEEIAAKFFQIEVSILSILNFKDLFERLLAEIREKFGVPYVWISLVDGSEISDMIDPLISSRELKGGLNIVDRKVFLKLIDNQTSPLLVNGDLRPYYPLLPQGQMHFIRSLAIAPLTLHQRIIGSLNQADFSELRYRPDMDTRLLEQLAVKVSICLSNVSAHERVKWLAVRDPLTGVLNRRAMESVLRREFKRARRYHKPLSLVFLDFDDFKLVNDRYGHECGDLLLRHVASHLESLTRDSDVVARYAGDEFVLILPETNLKEAHNLVGRLEKHLQNAPLEIDQGEIAVRVSLGVASLGEGEIQDPLALLDRADQRAYASKRKRKEK